MRNIPILPLAVLALITISFATVPNPAIAVDASVSNQGMVMRSASTPIQHSPGGSHSLEIIPTEGDFHVLVADLVVTTPDGQTHLLEGIEANGFLISDLGKIVAIETHHAKQIPTQVRIFDLDGNLLTERAVYVLTDPTLSLDGGSLAYRHRDGVDVLDLRDLEIATYPQLDRFAVGPDGLLAGNRVGDEANLVLYRDGAPRTILRLDERPKHLAFSPDGASLYILDRGALTWIDHGDATTQVIHRAAAGTTLRDLHVSPDMILVGARRTDGNMTSGELHRLDRNGRLIGTETGPSIVIPQRDQGDRTHESIPWPFEPNGQHPVGNTYGEYQNYGSSYLHPGVDVMTQPLEPTYAVKAGVVKAVLTTSGSWHWRIAIGEAGAGTSEGYLYAHIDQSTIAVGVGDPVIKGQYIGAIVEWPVAGFHHCHFARIEDTGTQWFGSWLCTDNPHTDFENQSETDGPLFEPARGSDLLAFSNNESTTYQDPDDLTGEVDIIAHVGDQIIDSWVCTVQQLRYTIYPEYNPQNLIVDNKLAVNFDMALDTYSGGPIDPFLVGLLYKDDATCNTQGDYSNREFFHILTNSDGNEIYEESDRWEAWDTSDLPDGDYVIEVTAIDAAGNRTIESMTVTTANGNPSMVGEGGAALSLTMRTHPNPSNLEATISFQLPEAGPVTLSVLDPAGRRIRTLFDEGVALGAHTVHWDGRTDDREKVPAGTYFIQLRTAKSSRTQKLVLFR